MVIVLELVVSNGSDKVVAANHICTVLRHGDSDLKSIRRGLDRLQRQFTQMLRTALASLGQID